MKLFGKSLLIYIGILILVTYSFGWKDLIGNKQLTGNVLKDISKSVNYFFTDVIIYWWLIIIIGGIVLAGITTVGLKTYTRLTNK